jgi:hypothetical protein
MSYDFAVGRAYRTNDPAVTFHAGAIVGGLIYGYEEQKDTGYVGPAWQFIDGRAFADKESPLDLVEELTCLD